MIALLIEFLFALVFARALVTYLRGRDTLMRDVMLVFAAMAGLIVIDVYRRLIGPPPAVIGALIVLMILGQPYLTLRLASRLRPVPRWLRWTALLAFLATATPLLLLSQPIPRAWSLSAIGVYVVTGGIAAAFLGVEARRRTGSPRVRLWLASAGTALMAVALLVIGAGAAAPAVAEVSTVGGRVLALLSGLTYLVAFMPPASLRRLWSGGAASTVGRRLLYAGDQAPEATWRRYAEAVREMAGADAVAVLAVGSDDVVVELTVAGMAPGDGGGVPREELDGLLAAAQPVRVASDTGARGPPLAVSYAHRANARHVQAVSLPLPSGRPAALLLINRYRSLFAEDDAQALADLGGQAAILAERGAVNAARERLAEELSASVSALAAASQAKTNFLSNMSHELRTPLNVIVGFSDLMRAEALAEPNAAVPAEWIDNVFDSGQHLLRLIDDVLDLAKVEAGRMELNPRELNVAVAVAQVTAALRPLLDRKRLRLVSAVPAITVTVDPIRFRQMLDNLLSNAIKFTPADGLITVEAAWVDDEVLISVSDTGVGIPVEDHQRVFEEFQQAGEEGPRHAGTGLGLALTRRLVEAHGGRIELESAPGHGTRFTVHLPAGAHPREVEVSTAPSGQGRGGILVIEDDQGSATLLRTYLESAHYDVSVARTGEAGLALARQHLPDAILLDILLPGMSGWDVLAQIKQDPRLRDVPVFIVTVLDERAVGQALDATDFFVKPVDRRRLLARLAEHVLTMARPNEAPSVLVVDDDPASLQLMDATLRHVGATVTTTADAADGLRRAHAHHFDLIITDLMMPDVDGFTIVTSLNDDPTTRSTPVLVVTAHDLSHADHTRLDGKVIGVVTKGSSLHDELRDYVDRIAAPLAATSQSAVVPTDQPEPSR